MPYECLSLGTCEGYTMNKSGEVEAHNRNRLSSLDILRGLACWYVVIFYCRNLGENYAWLEFQIGELRFSLLSIFNREPSYAQSFCYLAL